MTKLAEMMKTKKMTHTELAKKSGLAIKTIDFLAVGKLDITKSKFDTIQKLCSALKCKPNDIM